MLDHNRGWTEGIIIAEGALIGPWVVVYGILVLLFLLSYLGFFLSFPRKYIFIFFFAGVIFVLGAIGVEMIGGVEWTCKPPRFRTTDKLVIPTGTGRMTYSVISNNRPDRFSSDA